MHRQTTRPCRTIIGVFVLVTGSGVIQGSDTTAPAAVEAEAHALAHELLDPSPSKVRPPLSSDRAHARTIDPVMTEGTAIWIREALPAPSLTVLGGRVFTYKDVTYDALDAPVLKLRPVDDDQVVPFLIRMVTTRGGEIPKGAAAIVSFPSPLIFNPRIRNVQAWVGSDSIDVSVEASKEEARIDLRVPLDGLVIDSVQHSEQAMMIGIAGELVLGPHGPIPANRFSDFADSSFEPKLAGLASLEIGRDIATSDDRERLEGIADKLASPSSNSYDRVVAATAWVSDRLRYEKSRATRSPIEAVEDRSGDCDEHATLLVALLRAMRIPARHATGLLYNFDTFLAHAWVEVGPATRDGTVHWFIVDPTLAGTAGEGVQTAAFVQFSDRLLLYPVKPAVHLENMTGRLTTDIFLNWRKPGARDLSDPSRSNRLVELVTSSIDREISSGAERLADEGLLLHRQSASIVGSPYVIVDRPLADGRPTTIQLRLENEERLVLDLTTEIGSKIDEAAINELRAVYRSLSAAFFASKPAYHNLELVYLRDRHTDRLHTVTLRLGRYLLEHQLDRVLKRLSKANLLMAEESARIAEVADASGGRNLYLLQELARRLPSGVDRLQDE